MKQKKILVIFTIFILLLSVLNVPSFGSYTFNDGKKEVTLPDLPEDYPDKQSDIKNYCICDFYGNKLLFYTLDEEFYKFVYDTDRVEPQVLPVRKDGSICPLRYVGYYNKNGYWEGRSTWDFMNFKAGVVQSSSRDIYYLSGENAGTVFFSRTPLTKVGEIVKEARIQLLKKEIVSILPMILVVVVSFIGLRKALSMLSKLLRQA